MKIDVTGLNRHVYYRMSEDEVLKLAKSAKISRTQYSHLQNTIVDLVHKHDVGKVDDKVIHEYIIKLVRIIKEGK